MATILSGSGKEFFFREHVKGIKGGYREKRAFQRRVFDVPWADAWSFGAEMCGYPTRVDTAGAGLDRYVIRRCLPMVSPVESVTGQRFLYAKEFDIDGIAPQDFDASSNIGRYKWARVTIDYAGRPYRVLSDDEMPQVNDYPVEYGLERYVTPTVVPYGQFVVLPAGAFYFVPDDGESGISVDNTNGVIQVFANVTLTWNEVPVIPDASLSILGSVNDSTFFGKPAETLYYMGCSIETYRLASGHRVFDVQYMFRYFDPARDGTQGFNHILKYSPKADRLLRQPPKYVRVTHTGETTGEGPFQKFDFKSLFTADGTPLLM